MNKGKSKAQFGGGGWFDMVKTPLLLVLMSSNCIKVLDMKMPDHRTRYG